MSLEDGSLSVSERKRRVGRPPPSSQMSVLAQQQLWGHAKKMTYTTRDPFPYDSVTSFRNNPVKSSGNWRIKPHRFFEHRSQISELAYTDYCNIYVFGECAADLSHQFGHHVGVLQK